MNDTFETINCPACGKPMQKVFMPYAGFNLDVCTDGCGGIFFDGQELKHFDENHENIDDLKEVLKNKTFEKTNESAVRVCPVCGNNMVKNYVSAKHAIEIDECYNCGAKFMDGGELTRMREEYPTEEDRKQAFLAATYQEIGSQIDAMEIQNQINKSKRSVFLKLLDNFFLS
ncbi:zf-TFIIB domain-containing protein [bacterium]|nr:zf-TFIIB domain-containing protein [bacterium]